MAKATLYQKQYGRRLRRASGLRKKADSKTRLYAQRLLTALQEANAAARVLNQLNQTYGVDVSTKTLLTAELTRTLDPTVLSHALSGSSPGEEIVLFSLIADGHGGAELGSDWLLDSLPEPPAATAAPAPVAPAITVTKLQTVRTQASAWSVAVAASAPSGTYHLTNDASPYGYDFQNEHEMVFTLSDVAPGQAVQFTFTDVADPQVTLQRTLVLT